MLIPDDLAYKRRELNKAAETDAVLLLSVPYIEPLPRPVFPGLNIRIVGASSHTTTRVNINLQCGPSINPRDDVALNYAIHFDSQSLVLNNILGGQWGPPERQHFLFPVIRGTIFIVDILFEQEKFQIMINSTNMARFEHRLPTSRITHLAIDGDIQLHSVEYLGERPSVPIGFTPPTMPPRATPYPSSGMPSYASVPTTGANQCPWSPQAQMPTSLPGITSISPQQQPYPTQIGGYSQPTGLYPLQSGGYAQQGCLYAQQPGMYGQPVQGAVSPLPQHKQKGIMGKLETLTGGALTGAAGLATVKQMKKQSKLSKKAQKKALKYGLPIAGIGVGAYALHKTHGMGLFKGSSSSSSSSSDSD